MRGMVGRDDSAFRVARAAFAWRVLSSRELQLWGAADACLPRQYDTRNRNKVKEIVSGGTVSG